MTHPEVHFPEWSGTEVLVSVTRWIDREEWPAIVEAELVDADGRVWTFVKKETDFWTDPPARGAALPLPGMIRCEVVRDEMVDGVLIVHIDTSTPDGVDSVGGVTRFRVLRSMVT